MSVSLSSLLQPDLGGGDSGPSDRYRFGGPPGGSQTWRVLQNKDKDGNQSKGKKKEQEHRKLYLRCSVNSSSQGSAYLEQGHTKVMASVFGPREIPRRSDFQMGVGVLKASFKRTPFARVGARGAAQETDEEKEKGENLRQALSAAVCLHLYPKSQIDVYVTVLEDDGSAEAAAITCAGMALASASIKMFDLIVGASCLRYNDRLIVDPTLSDEQAATANTSDDSSSNPSILTVGYLPSQEQVAALLQRGDADAESVLEDLDRLVGLCGEVAPRVKQCLVDSITEEEKKSADRAHDKEMDETSAGC